ncbi:MAG: hypothetical protein U0414_40075 [Polyangiaceae bacterium]
MNAVGLYDLDRNPRPVGRAYKQLIHEWREVLPTKSVCLTLPLVLPQERVDAPADPPTSAASDANQGVSS